MKEELKKAMKLLENLSQPHAEGCDHSWRQCPTCLTAMQFQINHDGHAIALMHSLYNHIMRQVEREKKLADLVLQAKIHVESRERSIAFTDPQSWVSDEARCYRIIKDLAALKCDGNHGDPRCADPECWNQ